MRTPRTVRGFTIVELAFAVLSTASLLTGVGLFYRHVTQTLSFIETSKQQLLLRTDILKKVDCPSTVTPLGFACDTVPSFNLNYVSLKSETDTLISSVLTGPSADINGFKVRASCRNGGQNFISYQIDTKLAHPSDNKMLKTANDWRPASAIPLVCPARYVYFYETGVSDLGTIAMRAVMNRAYFGPFVSPNVTDATVFNDVATRERLCSLRGADNVDFFYPLTLPSCAGKESLYWDAYRKAFSTAPACSQPNYMVRLRCRRY